MASGISAIQIWARILFPKLQSTDRSNNGRIDWDELTVPEGCPSADKAVSENAIVRSGFVVL